jgi:hypothetical protein
MSLKIELERDEVELIVHCMKIASSITAGTKHLYKMQQLTNFLLNTLVKDIRAENDQLRQHHRWRTWTKNKNISIGDEQE